MRQNVKKTYLQERIQEEQRLRMKRSRDRVMRDMKMQVRVNKSGSFNPMKERQCLYID